jgi:hypothetical protein
LAAKVDEARRRLERAADPGRADGAGGVGARRKPGDDATVQLSIRVPANLRARVHAAAAAQGMSTQSWLSAAVVEAVDRALTPEGRAAAILVEEARRHLAQALADGEYERLIESLDDPDLR